MTENNLSKLIVSLDRKYNDQTCIPWNKRFCFKVIDFPEHKKRFIIHDTKTGEFRAFLLEKITKHKCIQTLNTLKNFY